MDLEGPGWFLPWLAGTCTFFIKHVSELYFGISGSQIAMCTWKYLICWDYTEKILSHLENAIFLKMQKTQLAKQVGQYDTWNQMWGYMNNRNQE